MLRHRGLPCALFCCGLGTSPEQDRLLRPGAELLCVRPAQPEYRMNGFDEFDVADRLRQRGWVRTRPRCLQTTASSVDPPATYLGWVAGGSIRRRGELKPPTFDVTGQFSHRLNFCFILGTSGVDHRIISCHTACLGLCHHPGCRAAPAGCRRLTRGVPCRRLCRRTPWRPTQRWGICCDAGLPWQSRALNAGFAACCTLGHQVALCFIGAGTCSTQRPWRAQAIRVLRVLCREEFGIASAKTFVEDVQRSLEWLTSHYIYTPEQVRLLMAELTWRATLRNHPWPLACWKGAVMHVCVMPESTGLPSVTVALWSLYM